MKRAVFIDKDGTLIPNIPYNVDPHLIQLEQNSTDGLKLLQKAGYLLVVISNQSGVGLGYFKEEDLKTVEQKIRELLNHAGLILHGFYYCPHHTEAVLEQYRINCYCRKPEPGMLFRAATELEIDLEESWMIGDILNDIEAGNRAGCRSVLIENGNETEWVLTDNRQPACTARSINEAADFIIRNQTNRTHGQRMGQV